MSYRAAKFRRIWKRPSRWDLFSEQQMAQVQAWLINEQLPYSRVQALIREKFAMRISEGAIFNYFQRVCAPIMLARARVGQPLTLDIIHTVRRGTEIIGEHKATIDLNKESAIAAGAITLPAPIQKTILENLN